MKVIICEPNKNAEIREIENDLETVQAIVGGDIEPYYPVSDAICIVCNEEGKIQGLPLSRAITDDNGELLDIIAGTFIICGIGSGDFADLPDDLAEKYLQKYFYKEKFYRVNDEIKAIQIK